MKSQSCVKAALKMVSWDGKSALAPSRNSWHCEDFRRLKLDQILLRGTLGDASRNKYEAKGG